MSYYARGQLGSPVWKVPTVKRLPGLQGDKVHAVAPADVPAGQPVHLQIQVLKGQSLKIQQRGQHLYRDKIAKNKTDTDKTFEGQNV